MSNLIEKYLGEASEVEFTDFDNDRQKFITSLVGKGKEKNYNYFSGIHGTIMDLNTGTSAPRFTAKELKKITSNKDVRWIQIDAIAMGNIDKE